MTDPLTAGELLAILAVLLARLGRDHPLTRRSRRRGNGLTSALVTRRANGPTSAPCTTASRWSASKPLYAEHQPTEKRRDPARCGHCGQTTEGA